MCGIGAIFTREPVEQAVAVMEAMMHRQRHRGPDVQSVCQGPDGRVVLGHARLSIVDLSPQGNQPMPNETETLWLVFNGEIYNHRDLRPLLEGRGHRFRSRSDSEVILHLYEEYGDDLVHSLHGMFAFVLYDARKGRMLVARDRLGKKPVVYAQTAQGVVIASEIPAVRLFPGVDDSVDPMALALYLLRNLRHIPDPWTFYRGIRRLLPGHLMVVEQGRVTAIRRYWRPDFHTCRRSPEELLQVFDRAVALRRVADVEVGALLSGGVDSSGIVQAMIAQGTPGIRTYALGRDRDDEELRRARRVAEMLGTCHREFYFDPGRQHLQMEELLRIYGEPIMLLPLAFAYELCQHIRDDGIRVVMTGHGADEIYYGYGGNNSAVVLSALLPFVPNWMRGFLGELGRRLAPGSRLREALLVASCPEGQRKAALYRDEARRVWSDLLCVPDLEKQVEQVITEWLGVWFEEGAPAAYIDEANVVGLMHENAHSVTIAGDLPAMAASVEVRCPFLDQELVQLAWHTDYRQKVPSWRDPSRNKWILKRALERRLPQDLLYAPKRGFGYYIQEEDVLRGPWKEQVDRAFAEMGTLGGVLNVSRARELKERFDARQGVPAILIAKLYAAMLFDRQVR
ncbi:MAG: asparagine synthase (glutamine-hydrolyzing) [Chloroherpetonaceae bacterium]|nr:asparagine synthase (glutamine-hydrolyzing) [Chthonomonadaceae bacterium]MDW8208281.1 asparagine synthase (glutamine-hydrolyzing) [Chloroherpetonaceae bacterium]